jgi:hypothetical protein
MTTEEVTKSEHEEDESKEEEKEDKEKSTFDASLQALTETIKGFDISGLKEQIGAVSGKIDGFDARLKALEEPTDLPAKPKVSAEDDIGAKIKTPDTYQSNSQQAGIKESDPENSREGDKNNLSMQEKSLSQSEQVFTTETPRPGAALESVDKSAGIQLNPVLKAAREVGHEGMSTLGRRILKGDFGVPEGEVPQW